MSQPHKLLRLSSVISKTGLGKSSIYNAIKAGTFPRPIKLGAKAIAFHESDIDAWIQSRPTASMGA